MSDWPATLPALPLREGYKETLPKLTIRSSMDVGPAKVRRRGGANVRKHEVSMDMTGAQVEIFDVFFLEECAGGALPYNYLKPRTGVQAQFRFDEAPPEIVNIGGDNWNVSFKLEELP